jgi:large subunit ribosomal protein L10
MSKYVKDLMTREYDQRFSEKDSACVVSIIGMDAISTNNFRGSLREKNIRIQVVKNSLARRAFTDTPLEPLGKALEGPCALVVSDDDTSAIDMAKTLVGLKKAHPKLELKMGILEGDPDLIDVEQLAKMKGREELLSDLAGQILAPAARLAGCLAGPGGRLAGCFKAMAEKEGEGE